MRFSLFIFFLFPLKNILLAKFYDLAFARYIVPISFLFFLSRKVSIGSLSVTYGNLSGAIELIFEKAGGKVFWFIFLLLFFSLSFKFDLHFLISDSWSLK